jgi:hypothetical protein
VDNIIIIVYPKYYSDFLDFKAKLIAAYKIRDIGELKRFLGIKVTRDRLRRRIWLSQDSYIQKIYA